jgi:crossover junction endodeoxyribonuclease RuvC
LSCPSPLIIAGIDPGSLKTGYAFLEMSGSAIRPAGFGVISTAKYKSQPDKYLCIHESLKELLEKFHPAEGAVEDIFHHKNVRSAFILGQARGVALLTLAMCSVEVYSYPPALIKKAVAAYGRADKQQVQHMVKAVLGLREPVPVDASDALAVALTHAQSALYRRRTAGVWR